MSCIQRLSLLCCSAPEMAAVACRYCENVQTPTMACYCFEPRKGFGQWTIMALKADLCRLLISQDVTTHQLNLDHPPPRHEGFCGTSTPPIEQQTRPERQSRSCSRCWEPGAPKGGV